MNWSLHVWRNHRGVTLAVVLAMAAAAAVAVVWPVTDWLAAHDVGRIIGPHRAVHLQAAREAVRRELLLLGAGLVAAVALAFTALNYMLSRGTQVTDRYTKAVEQLGSGKLNVRIGGIYALERVARDSAPNHPTVMDVLAAFVREHPWEEQQQPSPEPDPYPADAPPPARRPDVQAADVQAAITVIGRRDVTRDRGRIDLSYADLTAADMSDVDLSHANLFRVKLTTANLSTANLAEANLRMADLSNAELPDADLSGANLSGTGLSYTILARANLTGADLRGANFFRTRLMDAKLNGADLSGAKIFDENFTGAILVGADLSNVDLTESGISVVDLTSANLTDAVISADAPVPQGWVRDPESGRLFFRLIRRSLRAGSAIPVQDWSEPSLQSSPTTHHQPGITSFGTQLEGDSSTRILTCTEEAAIIAGASSLWVGHAAWLSFAPRPPPRPAGALCSGGAATPLHGAQRALVPPVGRTGPLAPARGHTVTPCPLWNERLARL